MPSVKDTLASGYAFAAPVITLGAAIDPPGLVQEPRVAIPTAMMNRHGLVAGATGTGKTKTLQLMTEQLSAQGIPVFVADIKGDVSGLAVEGARSPAVDERATAIGLSWTPTKFPVEFVSLTGKTGAQLRATVASFGPLLLSKVLGLNDTQTSVLTLVFRVCDDQGLPLLDFADLRAVLKFLQSDAGKPILAELGGVPSATVGVLLRQLVELESQGAGQFFGEPEFDVRDLLHVASDGHGVITALELSDAQDKPALFSTVMMWLLAELYQTLPEAGDLPKPKLVFFFDEAHLLFRDASKAFLDHVEQVVRLESASSSSPKLPRTSRTRSWPNWATGYSTRFGPTLRTTKRPSKPRCGPSPRRSSTTSPRHSPPWGSGRRSLRGSIRRECRRR
jgi:DNA helicase HerA-like ATPase